MNLKKISVILLLILLLISILIVPYFLGNANRSITKPITHESIDYDTYLIEGVPYVSQETNFYCSYASITMIFNYYKRNTSLDEILYSLGNGYSLLYQRSYSLTFQHLFSGGYLLCQNISEQEFLASLFALSYEIWYPDLTSTSDSEYWQEYWPKIKNHISNDVPVITSVDPYSIPYLREKLNSDDFHGGHALVLVGFNESNNTVCYNDPAAGLWNDEENGTYVNLSQDIFRGAVQNTTGSKYVISVYLNNSGVLPIIKEQRFQKAHERNIQKMKGEIGVRPNLRQLFFAHSGINALKTFKKDLRTGLFRRMLTVFVYSKLPVDYTYISIEKQNASQYLKDIKNSLDDPSLINICNYESSLLQKEANQWDELNQYFLELYDIGQENRFLQTLLKSVPITLQTRTKVNELISLEKQIIRGPN